MRKVVCLGCDQRRKDAFVFFVTKLDAQRGRKCQNEATYLQDTTLLCGAQDVNIFFTKQKQPTTKNTRDLQGVRE